MYRNWIETYLGSDINFEDCIVHQFLDYRLTKKNSIPGKWLFALHWDWFWPEILNNSFISQKFKNSFTIYVVPISCTNTRLGQRPIKLELLQCCKALLNNLWWVTAWTIIFSWPSALKQIYASIPDSLIYITILTDFHLGTRWPPAMLT